MLYSFSSIYYGDAELADYVKHCTEQDAILLWQDGILLALKYPHLWQQTLAACYLLKTDLQARNLKLPKNSKFQPVSMHQLVEITERHFPQLAL